MFDRCIFKDGRPSPKSRANSWTESDSLDPSQHLILHYVHGGDKNYDGQKGRSSF